MDLHYEIATVLLVCGYAFYLFGICSNSWKRESGYDFGLWFRCDEGECHFHSVDYMDNLNVTRIGVVLSTVFMAVAAICLLAEVTLAITHSAPRHKRRLGNVVIVATILFAGLTFACLGMYGSSTVIRNRKLPSLQWGFASTGVGVIVSIMGTLLRILGPVSTWYRIPCFKAKTRPNKRHGSPATVQGTSNRRRGGGKVRGNGNKIVIRPSKISLTQPSDVITYRRVAGDSYEDLLGPHPGQLSPFHQDHPNHRYEPLNLHREAFHDRPYNDSAFLNVRSGTSQSVGSRTAHSSVSASPRFGSHRSSPVPSYRSSPRTICHDLPPAMTPSPMPSRHLSSARASPRPAIMTHDLSPHKASSLPPGVSPGFYTKNHRHRPQNDYVYPSRPSASGNAATIISSPKICYPRPMRFQTLPTRQLSITTTSDNSSVLSEPMPGFLSSPTASSPSPPLPPPPPPLPYLQPSVTVERVNLRPGDRCGNATIRMAPSINSLQSFGSHGY